MEQFRKFLRGKGYALILTACLLAAAAAGVWAVRTVREELEKNLDGLHEPDAASRTEQGLDLTTPDEEDLTWQQQTAPAANSASDVPETASSAVRKDSDSSGSAAGSSSGSGSLHEPSALQSDSAPASSSAAPASTQPVSGRILNGYSGDELVYNKTLGDWRTHNGIDYAAGKGRRSAGTGRRPGDAGRVRWKLGTGRCDRGWTGTDLAALWRDSTPGKSGRLRDFRPDDRCCGQCQL